MNKHLIGMGLLLSVALFARAQTPICVATNGTNDVANRFNTWAGAATNIHWAVALATNNDTILVSNGVWLVTNQLNLASGVTVRGVGGRENVVLTQTNSMAGTSYLRFFSLTNSAQLVDSLTLSNGFALWDGGAIEMTAGTVSNCVVKNCKAVGNTGQGGGIYMSSGLVTRCTIQGCSGGSKGGDGVDMEGGGELRDCVLQANGGSSPDVLRVNKGLVRRCVVCSNGFNTTYFQIVYVGAGGRLENCLVYNNIAAGVRSAVPEYGAIYVTGGAVVNCTIASNTCAVVGGNAAGVYLSSGGMTNCIVYNNKVNATPSDIAGNLALVSYSCSPGLTPGVNGNLNCDPQFVNATTGNYHLATLSPCIDAGTNLTGVTTDLDGASRPLDGRGHGVAVSDMGAYEAAAWPDGTFAVSFAPVGGTVGKAPFTNTLSVIAFGADTNIAWYGWDTNSDGTWDLAGPNLGTQAFVFGPGRYTVTLAVTNSSLQVAQTVLTNVVSAVGANLYVATNGTSQYPYTTPATGATNVCDAIEAAVDGCAVNIGTGAFPMVYTEQIASGIQIRGAGTNATVLYRSNNNATYQLFVLQHPSALLSGLVLTNGRAPSWLGGGIILYAGTVSNCAVRQCAAASTGSAGGGIYMTNGLVTYCTVEGCYAGSGSDGGGVSMSGGELRDSTLQYNTASVGSSKETLYVANSMVNRCIIRVNTNSSQAVYIAAGGRLENCLVAGNYATTYGGVYVNGGAMVNCTIASNTCPAGGTVGGAYLNSGGMTNSIVFLNLNGTVSSNFAGVLANARYSCAPELTAGVQGNITNNPLFKNAPAGDYRLAAGSTCINAGTNFPGIATLDLDRLPRFRHSGAVDMGAYESLLPAGMLITFR